MMPIQILPEERRILRDLASKVAAIAAEPVQSERLEAVRATNACRSEKPLVYCFPEGAWLECIPPQSLVCQDPLLRGWETRLRMAIMSHEYFEDDQPVETVFNVPYDVRFTEILPIQMEPSDQALRQPYFLQAFSPLELSSHSDLGAFHWTPPLQDYGDIEKIQKPRLIHNAENSEEWLSLARELFGDILRVRRRAYYWELLSGFPVSAVFFRGMENLWMDLMTEPDWVRELIKRLEDCHHACLDQLEAENLLTLNNESEWIGTGGLGCTTELPGPEYDPDHVRLRDIWGGVQAQDLVGISPEMFSEFFLTPCKGIMNRFGLTHWGCCEPIHVWINDLKNIKNLRRVSVSPFSDTLKSAQALGPDYVYSWKPLPSQVCGKRLDAEKVRQDTVKVLRQTREYGCHVEIIMKDLHTVCHEPERLRQWVALMHAAIQEVYE